MSRVLAISGSLRKDSYNSRLVSVLPPLAPPGMKFDFFEELAEVPLYNEDLDTDTPPPAVARLRAAIEAHDGIVLAAPEYLRSVSGVVKNALDWASRPVATPSFSGKVVLVVVATPGRANGFRGLSETGRIIDGMRNVVVPSPEVVINLAPEVLLPAEEGGWRLADPVAQAYLGVQLAMLNDLLEAGVGRAVEDSFRRRTEPLIRRMQQAAAQAAK